MRASSNYKVHALSCTLTLLGIALLLLRFVLTHTIFYAFLVWNLFLAALPFFISQTASKLNATKTPKIFVLLLSGLWLLFLPNSFYIITDLKHLVLATEHTVLLDVILVLCFAINGVVLGFYAIDLMLETLTRLFPKLPKRLSLSVLFLLCGFGVYLGRELRWNSWDILTQPLPLLEDIFLRLSRPFEYLKTWGITIIFTLFLGIHYYFFSLLRTKSEAHEN